jgi:hypothetical protein
MIEGRVPMKKLLCGLAALPLFAGVALAQPLQLTNTQMDKVTAGFALVELDLSNTSAVLVSVYQGSPPGSANGLAPCGACYLDIQSPAISVQSIAYSFPGSSP